MGARARCGHRAQISRRGGERGARQCEYEGRLHGHADGEVAARALEREAVAGVPGGRREREAPEGEQAEQHQRVMPDGPVGRVTRDRHQQAGERDAWRRRSPVRSGTPARCPSGSTTDLDHSRASSRYGCNGDAPRRPCKRAFVHCVSPGSSGASSTMPQTWTAPAMASRAAHPSSPRRASASSVDEQAREVERIDAEAPGLQHRAPSRLHAARRPRAARRRAPRSGAARARGRRPTARCPPRPAP